MSVENSDIRKNGFKQISKYRGMLMGIATIWILAFHVWIPVFNAPSNPVTTVLHHIEEYIRKTGFYGVDLFLLLSGIGLTYAIKKESVLKFYYRRIRRVFLPFFVAALVRWPISHWTFGNFISNVTGYSFYANHIHSFCWFVTAIITLYIAFPLYYKLFSMAKNKFLFTLLVIAVWLVLSILLHGTMRFDLYGFTGRIPVFVIGILFGHITQSEKEIVFKKRHYLFLLLILASGIILGYIYTIKEFEFILPGAKATIPGTLIAVSLSFLVAKLMEILDRRLPKLGKAIAAVIGFWGAISLEIYCVYECLLIPYFQKAVKALAGIGLTSRFLINIVIFAASTLIAFLAGLLFKYFWKLIELPKSRKKIDNSKHEQNCSTK